MALQAVRVFSGSGWGGVVLVLIVLGTLGDDSQSAADGVQRFVDCTKNRLGYTSPHKHHQDFIPRGVCKVYPCVEDAESIFSLVFIQVHGVFKCP